MRSLTTTQQTRVLWTTTTHRLWVLFKSIVSSHSGQIHPHRFWFNKRQSCCVSVKPWHDPSSEFCDRYTPSYRSTGSFLSLVTVPVLKSKCSKLVLWRHSKIKVKILKEWTAGVLSPMQLSYLHHIADHVGQEVSKCSHRMQMDDVSRIPVLLPMIGDVLQVVWGG